MQSVVILVCALLVIVAPGAIAGQAFIREPATASDFPMADELVRSSQLMGLRATAAELALANAPDRAATFELLLASGRPADALTVLERIVAERPDEMRAAFTAIGSVGWLLTSDAAHGYADRLQAIVTAARQQLADFPPEEAAGIARVLVDVDSSLAPGAQVWRQRLAAFVVEYPGTQTALLAAVDLFGEPPGQDMLAAVDAFVREHPHTEAAAKALHTKGLHLAVNAFSFGERPGHDPTDRFFRVLDVFRELRSGRYPPSPWVDQASSLLTRFSAYKPSYAPGNLERILAAYEELLPSLLDAYERNRADDALLFFIGHRMGELFKLQGDPLPRIEAAFERLERLAKNAFTVRLLRVDFYLRPPSSVVEVRETLRVKARGLLESLVDEATPFERRKALATLATLRFGDGDLEPARALYQQYLQTYPDSDYSWVAALRIGQCDELSDPAGAAARFRDAAARFPSNPLARVLGHAYAARAWEAAGRFDQAMADYEAALGAWDGRYGRYALPSPGRIPPGRSPMLAHGTQITRDDLQNRIGALKETTATAGGALVERARWLLSGERWDEAIAAATEFLSTQPTSVLAGDARYLRNWARLEKALAVADADDPDVDIAPAIAELDALTREPVDAAVAAAKLALGTLLHLSAAAREDARTLVGAALRDWQNLDRSAPSSASGSAFERDVVEVRNAVFRPDGGGPLGAGKWDSFKWSASLPFVLSSPVLRVRTGGEVSRVVAFDPFPHVPNAVFLDDDRRLMLERIVTRLGGTKKRPWVRVMDTPNQPDGPALDVMAFWRGMFWVQPGHWGGWIFEGFPIINEIEFIDTGRTRAAVKVRVGYTGATVHVEKRGSEWTMKQLTNFWIE
jgi:tetratricopeptide (TPR) repeat protein